MKFNIGDTFFLNNQHSCGGHNWKVIQINNNNRFVICCMKCGKAESHLITEPTFSKAKKNVRKSPIVSINNSKSDFGKNTSKQNNPSSISASNKNLRYSKECIIIYDSIKKCLNPSCNDILQTRPSSYMENGHLIRHEVLFCPHCRINYVDNTFFNTLKRFGYYELDLSENNSFFEILLEYKEKYAEKIKLQRKKEEQQLKIQKIAEQQKRQKLEKERKREEAKKLAQQRQLDLLNHYRLITPESYNVYICQKKFKKIQSCYNCQEISLYYDTLKLNKFSKAIINIQVKRCYACGSYHLPPTTPDSHINYLENNNFQIHFRKNLSTADTKKTSRTIVDVKDFIVRTSTLKCQNSQHNIQNITAIIRIVDYRGTIVEKMIPAGYCKNCNIYFIMEDTYQRIKNFGVILCRITDEKTYRSYNNINNKWNFSKESILMQYGYNVSQTKELSEEQRHKILSVIIDFKVLSKSEIISYLDNFIRFRKSRPQYAVAISRWNKDKQFVNNYKIGKYQKIYINSITRK